MENEVNRSRNSVLVTVAFLIVMAVGHFASAAPPRSANAALLAAIKNKDWSGIRAALERGARLEPRAERFLILSAAIRDQPSVLRVLAKRGSPLLTITPGTEGPLHVALRRKARESVLALLSKKRDGFDIKGAFGETPLMLAVANDDLTTARLLLRWGADPNAVDNEKQNVLGYAGSPDAALLLLYYRATPPLRSYPTARNVHLLDGLTPLMAAAREGDAARVRDLIRSGASFKADGDVLMKMVVAQNDIPIARFLLENGVAPSAAERDGLPMTGNIGVAARAGHPDMVRLLLSYEKKHQVYDQTPGPESNTDYLLTDIAGCGDVATAHILLSAGFSPNVQNTTFITDGNMHYRFTPLQAAIRNHHTPMVALLLDNGAPASGKIRVDITGECTPLSMASLSGDAAIVRLLLRHEANPREKVLGKTPAAIAREAGHADVAALLEK